MELPTSYRYFQDSILEWRHDNPRSFPWRETSNSYRVLIAELLLQRTNADKVEPIYELLIDKYPNPRSLADASIEDLRTILRPLGLQNKRSEALVNIAQYITDYGVPAVESELKSLPFVGQYTANAILCFAFDEKVPILDRNVIRVYERAFDVNLEYRDERSWEFASKMLPDSEVRGYNLALLDFAAEVCRAPTPKCKSCFYRESCHAYPAIVE